MAAFTTFSREQLERYITMFGIGDLHDYRAIEAGIENSNYFVTLVSGTDHFEFVLTITEGLGFEDTAFFNDLLSVLDRSGLPVPNPERTLDGMVSTIFCGKPAWLFPKLTGEHPTVATVQSCEQIGSALADIHLSAKKVRYDRANPYSGDWASQTFTSKQGLLDGDDAALLKSAVEEYRALEQREDLPRGIIHGDMFKDNTFFDDDRLTGIIDFYHACSDFLIQDIAITINAWAVDESGAQDPVLTRAILAGYESRRPLEAVETAALPAFIRAGAARFALTRLISGEEGAHLKDPAEFIRILRAAC